MPHPLVRANPGWTNSAILRHWDALERLVGPRRMPKVYAHTARRLVAIEYGSGAYGTVIPTETKGLVLKVTSDPTEAKFAEVVRRMPSYPGGVVRYRAVLRLSGTHKGFPIFALWREEAYDVGTALNLDRSAIDHLDTIRNQADEAFRLLHERPQDRPELARSTEECAGRSGFEGGGDPGLSAKFGRWLKGAVESAGCGVDAARAVADAMARAGGKGRYVGASIRDLIDRGILLADVHPGNVGAVPRGDKMRVVITDPGHATFLTGAYDHVKPMGLAGVADADDDEARGASGSRSVSSGRTTAKASKKKFAAR